MRRALASVRLADRGEGFTHLYTLYRVGVVWGARAFTGAFQRFTVALVTIHTVTGEGIPLQSAGG